MKKGKKMPAIELEGHSEARFALVDGKIVRVDAPMAPPHPGPQAPAFEGRLRE
jgi:hypothetical protein